MVQLGEAPIDWKPMRSVGKGVLELRLHRGGEFRVISVATFGEAVYVLHCFRKKSGATPRADIETARRRFMRVIVERRSRP